MMRKNYEDDKEVACEKILIVMVIEPGTSLLMLFVACYDVIIIKPGASLPEVVQVVVVMIMVTSIFKKMRRS